MRFSQTLGIIALFCPSLPLNVLAKRGGSPDGSSSGSSSGGSSPDGSAPPHFSLDATNATIFAFSIIFALLTALQAFAAFVNIYKRLTGTQVPTTAGATTSPPVLDVGRIFPISLLLSILTLTVVYIIRAIFWAIMFNEAQFSPSALINCGYISAWATMGYLTDIFLIFALLALICYRAKALRTYSGRIHLIKPILDEFLLLTLLGVGMGYVGFRVAVEKEATRNVTETRSFWVMNVPQADLEMLVDVSRAYNALFLIAVIDVVSSSVFLWFRAQKQNSFHDRKLATCLMGIISPMLILYAIFNIIPTEIMIKQSPTVGPWLMQALFAGMVSTREWDLATVIIDCTAKFVIISMCLRFGVPPREQAQGTYDPRFMPGHMLHPHQKYVPQFVR